MAMKDDKYIQVGNDDDALLDVFFASNTEKIADDGFTERVMAAVAAQKTEVEGPCLRCWSIGLNIVAALASIMLLVHAGFFGMIVEFLRKAVMRVVVGFMSIDLDSLLVQTLLFVHRLPEMLPSATQVLAIGMATIVVMTLGIQQLVRRSIL